MLIIHKNGASSSQEQNVLPLSGDQYYITHKANGRDVLTMIVPQELTAPEPTQTP